MVKGELEGRETQSKTMEAELQRKWKALEQARTREDKLIYRLKHVRMCTIRKSPPLKFVPELLVSSILHTCVCMHVYLALTLDVLKHMHM